MTTHGILCISRDIILTADVISGLAVVISGNRLVEFCNLEAHATTIEVISCHEVPVIGDWEVLPDGKWDGATDEDLLVPALPAGVRSHVLACCGWLPRETIAFSSHSLQRNDDDDNKRNHDKNICKDNKKYDYDTKIKVNRRACGFLLLLQKP